jgi:hypothetical protein
MTESVKAEDSFAAALLQAQALGPPPPGPGPLDAFRTEATEWLARLPEPPLYPRSEDPARSQAAELLHEGIRLLARGWGLKEYGRCSEADLALTRALHAHVECLAAITEGRIAQAEEAWARANAFERESRVRRRAWVREDQMERPVWDARAHASRYDPRPAPSVRARLPCAHPNCRTEQDVTFPPSYALHPFVCARCHQPFSAYLAESQEVRSSTSPLGRRHRFRLEPLGGGASRVEFEDASPEPLHAARGDLLAFLYTAGPVLRGVSNLSSGRTLWVRRAGACFLATQAFGEGAPELRLFRAWRDEVLTRSWLGRLAVACYYRGSPVLVRRLEHHPWARARVRKALDALARRLSRKWTTG